MSVGELAAMVAAIALCVLVALMAAPLLKLRKSLDQWTAAIERVSESTVPAMEELRVAATNANANLDKISLVTEDAGKVASHAAEVSEDAAQFSNLVGSVFQKPLIKTAAFTYGVRKAIGGGKQ